MPNRFHYKHENSIKWLSFECGTVFVPCQPNAQRTKPLGATISHPIYPNTNAKHNNRLMGRGMETPCYIPYFIIFAFPRSIRCRAFGVSERCVKSVKMTSRRVAVLAPPWVIIIVDDADNKYIFFLPLSLAPNMNDVLIFSSYFHFRFAYAAVGPFQFRSTLGVRHRASNFACTWCEVIQYRLRRIW